MVNEVKMYNGLLQVKNRKKGRKYQNEETQKRKLSPRPRSRRASLVESLYESTVLSIEEENKQKPKNISDDQWKSQRKKIGLSKSFKSVQLANSILERKKVSALTFIKTHFNGKNVLIMSIKTLSLILSFRVTNHAFVGI